LVMAVVEATSDVIHSAGCRHCNHGNGARGGSRPDNGTWHSASSVDEAVTVAQATGRTR